MFFYEPSLFYKVGAVDTSQKLECLPQMYKALGLISKYHELDILGGGGKKIRNSNLFLGQLRLHETLSPKGQVWLRIGRADQMNHRQTLPSQRGFLQYI